MATDALKSLETVKLESISRARPTSVPARLARILMPLTSLRLTVVLFAMAIFLVFAGTLAQVDKDIWEVMNQYFRAFFAWIDFQIFFPKSFFAGEPPKVPGGFPFPGGWLIGGAMGINLLAAHALRFKVQARGARLALGTAVIAVGAVLTWMVIVGGSGKDTIEGPAALEWGTLWTAMKLSLVGLWLSGAPGSFRGSNARAKSRSRPSRSAKSCWVACWRGSSGTAPTPRWAIRRCAFCGN